MDGPSRPFSIAPAAGTDTAALGTVPTASAQTCQIRFGDSTAILVRTMWTATLACGSLSHHLVAPLQTIVGHPVRDPLTLGVDGDRTLPDALRHQFQCKRELSEVQVAPVI